MIWLIGFRLKGSYRPRQKAKLLHPELAILRGPAGENAGRQTRRNA
jgi:hypothetical protein